jgi:hypothetical protein
MTYPQNEQIKDNMALGLSPEPAGQIYESCRSRFATLHCGGMARQVSIWDFHADALTSGRVDALAIFAIARVIAQVRSAPITGGMAWPRPRAIYVRFLLLRPGGRRW